MQEADETCRHGGLELALLADDRALLPLISRIHKLVRDLPRPIRLFCLVSVLLTVGGLGAEWVCRNVLHLTTYPYAYYSLGHDGWALDLTALHERFQHVHSRDFFNPQYGPPYPYPAALAPLYWLFHRLARPAHPFLALGAAAMAVLAFLLVRALRRHGMAAGSAWLFVTVAAVCSYAFYFEFTRANMELWLWLCCAAAVYALLRGWTWTGSALLGVAIAMKLYPFILLGLLVSRRQYRQAAFSLVVAAAANVLSLWMLCPDIRYANKGISTVLTDFQNKFVIPYLPGYAGVDHSLYGLIKGFIGPRPTETYTHIFHAYMVFAAVAGLVLYFAWIRKLPFLNQVLALTAISILLPPVSDDYTLIHLYTPFAMLAIYSVDAVRRGDGKAPGLTAMWLCLAVLLSQEGEFILHGERRGGEIKAVTLLIVIFLAVRYRLPSGFDRALSAEDLPSAS